MDKNNHPGNGLIVYDSKYGATHQYADWLASELKLPLRTPDQVTADQIKNAGFLVIGTPIYIGKFRVQKWLNKNIKNFSNKKLFVFIVNATAPEEQSTRGQFVQNNIPGELKENCRIYFLPGRIIHKKLSFRDKLLLLMRASTIKDPLKRKEMQSDFDNVKKDNLVPVIKAVKDYIYSKLPLSTSKILL